MRVMNAVLIVMLCAGPAAAALSDMAVSVRDNAGSARATFSNTESIALHQQVRNDTDESPSQVAFVFKVIGPSGAILFKHTGNAAPGTPGLAQTQLSGLQISRFYTTPGQYIFRGEATLTGTAPEIAADVSFTVASPNITLIYPPSGSRDLSDNPLTFRWTSSGAARYRVTVADNPSLNIPVHTGTNAGESSYSYPAVPSEPREQLVGGQVYYWKVEGLDAIGNKISESLTYSFSMRSESSTQSRNVMVKNISMTTAALDWERPISFKAAVYNGGGTTESNISLRFSLGGIQAQDSPRAIETLASGQTVEYSFTAFAPADQDQSLAVACVDIFDDNIPDNCKTLLVSRSQAPAGGTSTSRQLTYEEMWQAILQRLGPEAAAELQGYTFSAISCPNCTGDELQDIFLQLLSGEAELVSASVTGDDGAGASAAASEASADDSAGPQGVMGLDMADFDEWSGYSDGFANDKPLMFAARNRKEWRKAWETVASGDAPEINFSRKMVLVMVAGPGDNAEAIRILGSRKTDKGVFFDYYLIAAPKGRAASGRAVLFKLADKHDEDIRFNRIDVGR